MNIYGIIILAVIIIDLLLDTTADVLNIKNLQKSMPEEFKDVYDGDKYAKSQAYTKERTYFGIFSGLFSIAVTLIFWFFGGFNWLDLFLREFITDEIWRGMSYISVLLVANSILGLPFSIYSTFVIEEKYGFNKTTIMTFISDISKSLSLGAVIGLPILYLVLWLLGELGSDSWLILWISITVFSLIIQYIAPKVIMPLFNKFTPMEEGELKNRIMALADKTNFPLKDVYVMDGSKRSSKSNAFFTGFGKNKRIALFDTLIEKHTDDELLAVLAHEIGHYKKKHIMQSMIISTLHLGLILFLLSQFIQNEGLHEAFYMEHVNIYTGLIFFGMLLSPVEMIISLAMNVLSRKNEFEADNYSAKITNEPVSLIDALKKLSRDNLSNLTPHRFYVFINYSHPPVLKRIQALRSKH